MNASTKTINLDWLDGENIRPYIFVREDNRTLYPGTRFEWDWINFEPIYMNPLLMDEVNFADQILKLETSAFKKSGMEMPRWVFYDCAIMPGFVAGFAHRTKNLPPALRQVLNVDESLEWTPISLFIVIPCSANDEWVAHNLTSVNSLIERKDRLYGLGFLTKAFGLWHANIEICCGMTQWNSPALKLHSHYGAFEVLTAYTPVHSYPRTMTYRCRVNPSYWSLFFSRNPAESFKGRYVKSGFDVDPLDDKSLISFQRRIENHEGPFFLDSTQIRQQEVGAPLTVYRLAK